MNFEPKFTVGDRVFFEKPINSQLHDTEVTIDSIYAKAKKGKIDFIYTGHSVFGGTLYCYEKDVAFNSQHHYIETKYNIGDDVIFKGSYNNYAKYEPRPISVSISDIEVEIDDSYDKTVEYIGVDEYGETYNCYEENVRSPQDISKKMAEEILDEVLKICDNEQRLKLIDEIQKQLEIAKEDCE